MIFAVVMVKSLLIGLNRATFDNCGMRKLIGQKQPTRWSKRCGKYSLRELRIT